MMHSDLIQSLLVVFAVLLTQQGVIAQSCGQANQVCCSGNLCNAGLFCDNNVKNNQGKATCQYNCGHIGQYCCTNSASGGCALNQNLFCQRGLGSEAGRNFCIENCGHNGQRCCRNKWCTGGLHCNKDLKCQICPRGVTSGALCPNGNQGCGDAGQNCCKGNTCVAGTFCDTTSKPGQKICRPYCGAAGQRCCPVTSAGYDGCNKDQGVYCDQSQNTAGTGGTGLCTYNCGKEGQQCCPRGWCDSSLKCEQAKCRKAAVCGQRDTPCCNGSCQGDNYCLHGMCRQNCGYAGQPCCKHTGTFKCHSPAQCHYDMCY